MKKRIFLLLTVCMLYASLLSAQTEFRAITYQQALEASKAEGKPVFIDFYTSWCGPCKMMAKKVFPLQNVGDYMNSTFVCIQLDAEKEGLEEAKKYKISAYPTFIVIDADENVIFTKVGANLDGESFIEELRIGINPDLQIDKLQKKYDEGDHSAEVVSAYVSQLYRDFQESNGKAKDKAEKAKSIVLDYFNTLTDEQKLDEQNFFVYSYNYCDDPRQAQAEFLFANQDQFPDSRRQAVKDTETKLLTYRLGTFLQGTVTLDADEVRLIGDYMKQSGVNADGSYDASLRIADALTKGDDAFLAQFKKDFKKMNIMDKGSITYGYAELIKSDNEAILKKADMYLRQELKDMSADNIYYSGMSLMQIERRLNKDNDEH